MLKEEIDTLLNTNKSQGDEINDLREKLNDALTQVKTQSDSINNWNIEKEVSQLLELFFEFTFCQVSLKSDD